MRPPRKFRAEPFAYHQEVEVEITDLNNLGVGVGRVDGWVVLVPYSLPGERVRGRVWINHARYSEADLVAVLQPSAERVEPVCPLFGECGGCQYQHLAYDRQLRWKQEQVVNGLKRLAELEVPVEPTWPSPRQYGYRSKLTPHWARPRDDEPPPIGFLGVGSRRVIDVPHCPIATEGINAALPAVREHSREFAKGRKKGGTLLLREVEEGVVTDMKAPVTQRVGERIFQFQAGEFFQNNPYILPEMVGYVLGQARAEGIRQLVDAYCGVGLFAISAVGQFETIAGVDISPPAIAAAKVNARRNEAEEVAFLEATAETIFQTLPFRGGEAAVILDPPRKGCDVAFLEQLFTFGPRRVVYVSCDPATQARDLKMMVAAGFQVERVQPFDLFPQTRHIENVATLVKG